MTPDRRQIIDYLAALDDTEHAALLAEARPAATPPTAPVSAEEQLENQAAAYAARLFSSGTA